MNATGLLEALSVTLTAGQAAVWVTVVATRGSTPRAAGACMMVDARHSAGSIGGGALELQALDIARGMLAQPEPAMTQRVESFALDARCSQCCGGRVELAFDLLPPPAAERIESACARLHAGEPWPAALHGLLQPAAAQAPVDTARLQVLVYGAGHVGRALIEVLGRLPFELSWIDHRAGAFAAAVPPNTRLMPCDEPAAAVDTQPAGCAVLIMTPSHGLDLALTRRWLQRGDFRFLGLIGSQHKRRHFEHLLRRQGIDEATLSRLVCPLGITGISGKEPEIIAVAVAAQLLRLCAEAAGKPSSETS